MKLRLAAILAATALALTTLAACFGPPPPLTGTVGEKESDDGCWELDIVDDNGYATEICVDKDEWTSYEVGDQYPHPPTTPSS